MDGFARRAAVTLPTNQVGESGEENPEERGGCAVRMTGEPIPIGDIAPRIVSFAVCQVAVGNPRCEMIEDEGLELQRWS
jgi:hypothetical protein